jgi:hypothetical protein
MLLKRYDKRVDLLLETRAAALVRHFWKGMRDVQDDLPAIVVIEIERLEALVRVPTYTPTAEEIAHWEWWVGQLRERGVIQAAEALERLVGVEAAGKRLTDYVEDLRTRERANDQTLTPDEWYVTGRHSRSDRWVQTLPTAELEQIAAFDGRPPCTTAEWAACIEIVNDILTRYPDTGMESPWHVLTPDSPS